MVSCACGYHRGKEQWLVNHASENGIKNLDVYGSPPAEFPKIRDRLAKLQDEEDGDSMRVDYFFDIPVETAASLCGYRHDRWKSDGKPTFTVIEILKPPIA